MSTVTSAGGSPLITLSGAIEPTRLSPSYRLGLIVVAVAMLLLPLLYLAFIVLTGVTVWWHLMANTWILGGRGAQWRLLLYLTPAFAGLVLMFFMVKPIMARPARRQDPVPLDPDEAPALFAFIEEICRQVRAPTPRLVQADCQVNASAGFMGGRLGVFKKDLVLTIGLPLVAGLSVREFGGVLAHEFGHFAQGGGMRLTALVRYVNGWFARVVYERDTWDERLERWSKESDWRLSIVLVAASLAVWVSRKLLTGLMMAGHAISCFMMRQMEYDADSYEIKFAGSDAFIRTVSRLRELNLGVHYGYDDLRQSWQTRSALPTNLPGFLIARCARISDQVRSQAREVPTEATGVFDTHPSDGDRVRAARAAASAGILVVGEVPATQLFQDFDALGVAATRHHYEHDLGLSLDVLRFVETDAALQESSERDDTRQAFTTFFERRVTPYRPIRLELAYFEGLDPAALWSALHDARREMADDRRLEEKYGHFGAMARRRELAFAAQELLAVGATTVNAQEFDLAQATTDEAIATEAWAKGQQDELLPALAPFEAATARRLACALCLLRHTSEQDVHPREGSGADEATTSDATSLVRVTNAVGDALLHFHDLCRFMTAGSVLVHHRSMSPDPVLFEKRIEQIERSTRNVLHRIRDCVKDVPCPSSFTMEPMDVARWCGLSETTPATAADVSDRLLTLYGGTLGQLAAIALRVEAHLDSAHQSSGVV